MINSIRNKLFCFHPHGKMPFNTLYVANLLENQNIFGSIIFAVSYAGRVVPSVGWFQMMFVNTIDATSKKIAATLEKSNVGIFPGGAYGCSLCDPESNEIAIVKRDGFLRIALEKNIPVVPCFVFGTQHEYKSVNQQIEFFLYKHFGILLPIWYPFENHPIKIYYGCEIHPNNLTLNNFRELYYKELEKVFYKNKACSSRYSNKKLKFHSASDQNRKLKKVNLLFLVSSLFVIVFILYRIFNSCYVGFSTMTCIRSELHTMLFLHIFVSWVWSMISWVNSHRFYNDFHRVFGYVGCFFGCIMAVTGIYLALGMESAIQKFLNCVVAVYFIIGLQEAMVDVRNRNFTLHENKMLTLSEALLNSFSPRIMAGLFNFFFPQMTTPMNVATISMVILQVYNMYLLMIPSHRNDAYRRIQRNIFVKAFIISFMITWLHALFSKSS